MRSYIEQPVGYRDLSKGTCCMEREEATRKILEAKRERGLTFEAIAHEVGRHKEWTTAALHGQATMSAEEAERATAILGLGPDVAQALQECPTKGSLPE